MGADGDCRLTCLRNGCRVACDPSKAESQPALLCFRLRLSSVSSTHFRHQTSHAIHPQTRRDVVTPSRLCMQPVVVTPGKLPPRIPDCMPVSTLPATPSFDSTLLRPLKSEAQGPEKVCEARAGTLHRSWSPTHWFAALPRLLRTILCR